MLKKLNVHEKIVHCKDNYINLENRLKFIATLITSPISSVDFSVITISHKISLSPKKKFYF